jgi:hypothetical protein
MRDFWKTVKYQREREREVGHPWLSIISSLEFGREREHTRRNKKPEGTKN